MQLFWKEIKNNSSGTNKQCFSGDLLLPSVSAGPLFPRGPPGEMYQGFPGDPDSGSRGSSSPSLESQYLSSVDSFGSPPTTSAPQDCGPAGAGLSIVGSGPGTSLGADMPGSFVPTVTAITSSQDLQWLVQPTLVASQASGQSCSTGTATMTQPSTLVDPYDMPGTSYSLGLTPPTDDTPGPAPGPIRQSRTRSRRTREESVSEDGDVGVLLTPEEEEKRRVRRERNKLAAAKCRNRRRELTDRLQSETDVLEEEKAELEAEISELQKEKERLEFVLVAHQPNCKIHYQEQPQQSSSTLQPSVSIVGLSMKEDPFYLPPPYSAHPASSQSQLPLQQQQQQQQPRAPHPGLMQEVEFSSSFFCPGPLAPDGPCIMAGNSGSGGGGGGNHDDAAIGSHNTSYTSSFVFTYPEGACGVSANQRNSSSEQSSDSLNSPSLLAL